MGLLQTMGLVLLWQIIGQGLVLAVSTAGFDRDTRDTVTSELPATTWAPLRFWQKTEYPNPKYDTDKCGREGQKSYVCDPNRIMTLEEANKIDGLIDEIFRYSNCQCGVCPNGRDGYRFAVAMVNQMKLRSGTYELEEETQLEVERWADYLRSQAWAYGYCGDDLVLVLSKNDAKVFTSTGRITRRLLGKKCVDVIYQDARGLLRDHKYGKAIHQMIGDYGDVLLGAYDCHGRHSTYAAAIGGGLGVGAIVAIAITVICGPICICFGLVFCLSRGADEESGGLRGRAVSVRKSVHHRWRSVSRRERNPPTHKVSTHSYDENTIKNSVSHSDDNGGYSTHDDRGLGGDDVKAAEARETWT